MLSPLYSYLHTYAGISEEDFKLMKPFLEIRHFEKDVHLTEIGEVEGYVNFVKTGLIRKFFYSGKKEITTQLAKESDLISSSVSFFTGLPSEYIIETIEPSTTISLSLDNLNRLYETGPEMERMGRRIVADWLVRKERWETNWTLLSPKKRFDKLVKEHFDLFSRAPQKLLASYLSMTPETFSRYKHSMVTG